MSEIKRFGIDVSHWQGDFDFAVVNDTVANAVDHIKSIVEAEHVRVPRVINDYRNMVKED